MPSDLPVPRPAVTAETKPFWDAIQEGRFVLSRCLECEAVIWYPRKRCASCGSTDVTEFEASGQGTIYTYTVNHRGDGNYRNQPPYVLAYVELAEGPTVMTNIVECEPEEVKVGAAVELVFNRSDETGTVLYRFRLDR